MGGGCHARATLWARMCAELHGFIVWSPECAERCTEVGKRLSQRRQPLRLQGWLGGEGTCQRWMRSVEGRPGELQSNALAMKCGMSNKRMTRRCVQAGELRMGGH